MHSNKLKNPLNPDPLLEPVSVSEDFFLEGLLSKASIDWVRKGGGESFKTIRNEACPASSELASIYARMGPSYFVFLGHKTMTHIQIMSKVSATINGIDRTCVELS